MTTRCGTIVLAGRPNAGKSTLLNALVEQSLAIVSPKPQSTRLPVVGIRTDGDTQLVFVDPPGLFEPGYALQRSMLHAAVEALTSADALIQVHPATEGEPPPVESLISPTLGAVRLPTPRLVVLSQADRLPRLPPATPGRLPVSALRGKGLGPVLEWCRAVVPEGPFRYPADDISAQPVRFFAAEYVREAAFAHLEDEVPYAIAVEVDEFREHSAPVYIRMALYVERDSQKAIVIGAGGHTLRSIGTDARRRIETLLGQQVFLDLWVKVMPHWRAHPSDLQRLGFPNPPKEAR